MRAHPCLRFTVSRLSASNPLRWRLDRDCSPATLPVICAPNALSGAPQTISVRVSFIQKVQKTKKKRQASVATVKEEAIQAAVSAAVASMAKGLDLTPGRTGVLRLGVAAGVDEDQRYPSYVQ